MYMDYALINPRGGWDYRKCTIVNQDLKCASSKQSSSLYTIVRQHTRTVKVPTDLPRWRSYVSLKPHELQPSRSHGALWTTSAGWTTRRVSPVWNRPTTGCKRQVLSRGVTMPNNPATVWMWRSTFLSKEKKVMTHIVKLWKIRLLAYTHTLTCSQGLHDAHQPWSADRQRLHRTVVLLQRLSFVVTCQNTQPTPNVWDVVTSQ
jgi:hypothetical protein